ncbi:MSHA biogenesis protein MshF [Shewanella maritima]|uniref:MSHA biogenesis protein MshF n=1 Tax=Shewanella maritima TaxID=2520507 RepID=UPI003736831D
MLKQQQAEHDIIKAYGRIIAVCVLLLLLAVLGFRHFNGVPTLVGHSMAIEHNRFLHVLAMVRSQWMTSGRPSNLHLDWESLASNMQPNLSQASEETKASKSSEAHSESETYDSAQAQAGNVILMSSQGFPELHRVDVQGCYQLWHQLLASSTKDLIISYDADNQICRYVAQNEASISYQHSSGRVIFLEGSD